MKCSQYILPSILRILPGTILNSKQRKRIHCTYVMQCCYDAVLRTYLILLFFFYQETFSAGWNMVSRRLKEGSNSREFFHFYQFKAPENISFFRCFRANCPCPSSSMMFQQFNNTFLKTCFQTFSYLWHLKILEDIGQKWKIYTLWGREGEWR